MTKVERQVHGRRWWLVILPGGLLALGIIEWWHRREEAPRG